jgi:hypothetical protein
MEGGIKILLNVKGLENGLSELRCECCGVANTTVGIGCAQKERGQLQATFKGKGIACEGED